MSRATWADTLDEATIFLENNQPPRRSPEDRPLKACLKKVRGVLNDMRDSKRGTADEATLSSASERVKKFLKMDLRRGELLGEVHYSGEEDEWAVRLWDALRVGRRFLDVVDEPESTNGVLWSTTEKRAKDFIEKNYDYPRRAEASELRRLLADLLRVLEDMYRRNEEGCSEPLVYKTLRATRKFFGEHDVDLVKLWFSDAEHPEWITHVREATYAIRIVRDSREEIVTSSEPTTTTSSSNSYQNLQPNFNFPRHWRATPLRIFPGALPPLPQINSRRYDEIFGKHSSSTTLAIRLPGQEDYRPLDFIGDAFLGHLVSKILHRAFPSLRNGHLTYLRSLLVRNTTLSNLAWHYSFHTRIRPPRAHLDQKEMADLFEAYLGAVSLESKGERKAETWIADVFSPGVFPEAGNVARTVGQKHDETFWDKPMQDMGRAIQVVEDMLPPLKDANGGARVSTRVGGTQSNFKGSGSGSGSGSGGTGGFQSSSNSSLPPVRALAASNFVLPLDLPLEAMAALRL